MGANYRITVLGVGREEVQIDVYVKVEYAREDFLDITSKCLANEELFLIIFCFDFYKSA